MFTSNYKIMGKGLKGWSTQLKN